MVNGFWDWGSWWVSRWLGRHLLGKLHDDGASGERVWAVVWHGGIDLVLALLMLGTFAFFLAFAFESYNQLASALGPAAYQLVPFIDAAALAPWGQGLWLTVMLLSTLVPTALHGVMLLASPLALLFLATPQRAGLADALDGFEEADETEQLRILRLTGRYLHRRQLAWVGGAVLFW